jgi:hypothetical protein
VARIGGRNLWLAVPAGIICAGVVGTLGVLAAPMLPVAAAWVGDSFYNATHMRPPTTPTGTADRFASSVGSDCRSLYPDNLWSELTWTPDVLLSQTVSPPATGEVALTAALAPSVRVSCTWKAAGGASIATTVAEVGDGAEAVAQAALSAAGFSCTTSAGLECTRTQGAVVEEHVVRGGLWISSVETAWHPRDYSSRIVSRVWP